MKYGIVFPGGDARDAAELAHDAEQAGWDAFFVPDAPWWHNPWVTLAAVAVHTERIRFGTMITPVSRRKPWELASETATLDRLSNGRVILSVGLGAVDTGFAEFGEVTDRKARAELLDEGLAIITKLWRGKSIAYDGQHYHLKKIKGFPPMPAPIQKPHIPIWVVGAWPSEKSMQRVLRYDGLLPNPLDDKGKHRKLTPDDVRTMQAYLKQRRKAKLDIVVEGSTPSGKSDKAAETVREWAEAGATWWLESFWSMSGKDARKAVSKRITQGPPNIK